tara:strand:+ start:225 stop:404 length:180 start_codon:yes stop_codon:yes gene_type:complete
LNATVKTILVGAASAVVAYLAVTMILPKVTAAVTSVGSTEEAAAAEEAEAEKTYKRRSI